MLLFEKSEYRKRVENTKKSMVANGIELLIVSHPANMNYLTGYDGWSFYVHQCVLVSLDQEEPTWIGRGMDANGARITSYLAKENIYQYADDYVHSIICHPMDFVVDIIKAKGWQKKRIGVESDQFYFTHKSFQVLHKGLPEAIFVDANILVNWVRVIKSEAEIRFMKIAGKIAEKVMETAVKYIKVGARECDVAAQIVRAEYEGVGEYAGDYPAIVPLMMSGEAIKTPHLTWTEAVYQANEPVLLELCGTYRHYHCPIARTIFLGTQMPKKMKKVSQVVKDGLQTTLDSIKPGVSIESIEKIWRDYIARHGVEKKARLGYSIGVNYPPDWGEQTISVREGDKTIVQKNMTLHLIPGIWQEDVGYELDASIRVTDDGIEHLFDYPFDVD